MTPPPQRSVALAACCLAVTVWGIGPLVVHEISADAPALLFWRLLLAQPVMLGLAVASERRLPFRQMLAIWPAGVLFSFSTLAGFTAFRTTSIATATLIQALTPLVVMVVAPRLFGERVSGRMVALGAVALSGISLVVLAARSGGEESLHGDLMAVISLALFAAYFMYAKRARDRGVATATFLGGVFMVAVVVMTPVSLTMSDDVLALTAKDWILITGLVVGPGVVGHGLMTWSQRDLSMTTASLLTLASPVVSTVGAWLIDHQKLAPLQVVGIFVVLGALAGIVWSRRR